MIILSRKQQKLIRSKSLNGRISSKDFNAVISNQNDKANKNKVIDFAFSFNIQKRSENEYVFILNGRHYSTNSVNSFSFKNKLAYKKAIKQAVHDYLLINKKAFNKISLIKPFSFVVLQPIAYNPRSRDDDGNSATLKVLRDAIVSLKFVPDDKRKFLRQMDVDEVIDKNYKIEIILKGSRDEK